MITYVNTALVSSATDKVMLEDFSNFTKANGYKSVDDAGRFVIVDANTNDIITAYAASTVNRIKIGVVNKDGRIKWSNVINRDDVKSITKTTYTADTEDAVTIAFSSASGVLATGGILTTAGKRVVLRLTFKDTPTRYRKWTESYEYITSDGETPATIAEGLAAMINSDKNAKRARVTADGTTTSGSLVITAMKYDDDESVDSINVYDKVRFDANIYYTDPSAAGFSSKNKYFPLGTTVTKVPGKTYTATAKLVRDIEAQAMGYQGILNRGEGTWPIIKPGMNVELDKDYNSITIEFENMYRAADDIFRKTKQTVNIFCVKETNQYTQLASIIDAFIGSTPAANSIAIGDLSDLDTTAKNSLVDAINELAAAE